MAKATKTKTPASIVEMGTKKLSSTNTQSTD